MELLSQAGILIAGLIALVKGADFFVEAAARIARRLGVSDFVIGLTLTAIGTSIPELAAAVSASMENSPGLIIGNVAGSNIANIGLILGFAALLSPFATQKKMLRRDGYIMVFTALLFLGFALDNEIQLWEAIILLVSYAFYLAFLVSTDNEESRYRFRDFLTYIFNLDYLTGLRDQLNRRRMKKPRAERSAEEQAAIKDYWKQMIKDGLYVIAGGLAIMFGAKYMVDASIWIARHFDVPDSVIGLTVVAIGTSLPELSVAVSAARKGRGEIVVGNVLGSNVANTLLIIGVSGSISTLPVSEDSVIYTLPVMLFFSLACLSFIGGNWRLGRREGVIALSSYIIFMVMAALNGWG
jgi:cation:H+ antiporter